MIIINDKLFELTVQYRVATDKKFWVKPRSMCKFILPGKTRSYAGILKVRQDKFVSVCRHRKIMNIFPGYKKLWSRKHLPAVTVKSITFPTVTAISRKYLLSRQNLKTHLPRSQGNHYHLLGSQQNHELCLRSWWNHECLLTVPAKLPTFFAIAAKSSVFGHVFL